MASNLSPIMSADSSMAESKTSTNTNKSYKSAIDVREDSSSACLIVQTCNSINSDNNVNYTRCNTNDHRESLDNPSTGSQVSELQNEIRGLETAEDADDVTEEQVASDDANVAKKSRKWRSPQHFHDPHAAYLHYVKALHNNDNLQQMIQSVPFPMIATSVLIVFFLCVLLTECKTSLVGANQASQMELVSGTDARTISSSSMVQSYVMNSENPDGNEGELKNHQVIVGRKELPMPLTRPSFILDEMHPEGRKHLLETKRHSLGAMLLGPSSKHPESSAIVSPTQFNNGDSQEQSEGRAKENDESAEDSYIDGGPQPAHLRSSALELDMDEVQTGGHNHNRYLNNIHRSHGSAHTGEHQKYLKQHHKQHQPSSSPSLPLTQQQQHIHQLFSNNHDRPYDVAQIQCNSTDEGFERFACPTPDMYGRYRCIEDRLFCDGYLDCPGGEDEERSSCMYYKLLVSHIDILTNTFLTWMKKQNRQNNPHRFDNRALPEE